jgi:hypothetical protein
MMTQFGRGDSLGNKPPRVPDRRLEKILRDLGIRSVEVLKAYLVTFYIYHVCVCRVRNERQIIDPLCGQKFKKSSTAGAQ